MRKLILILILISGLILASACAAAPTEEEKYLPMPADAPGGMPGGGNMPRPTPVPRLPEADLGQTWATERMIIRDGDVSLVVEDVAQAMDEIAELAERFLGHVVSSKRWGEGKKISGTITIRVSADSFDGAIKALRELAVEVTSEETTSKDVTEEYVDLQSQLRNLEATEGQLLKLMERAETVEDALTVLGELSTIQGQIEQTKGRMQYLERSSSTSLIKVHLEQAKLDAEFTADKTRVKEGEEIHFFGQITGGFKPYSCEWDFDDGATSSEKNPIHVYDAAGSYTVSLRVTDDKGNVDTETRSEYITVLSQPGWSAGDIAQGAWNALAVFGHVLADIAIWLGIFSPVWLVIGGILYGGYRRKVAKERKRLGTQ